MSDLKSAAKLALDALNSYSINDFSGYEVSKHKTHIIDDAITAIKEALAEHAMREVQRLGQEIEQEPVAWPCHIIEADFSERTITLGMECGDYKVSAGTHWLSTTPPKETT
jgi:hypothetical protein